MSTAKGFSEENVPFEPASNALRSVAHTRLKVDSAGRIVIPAEMRSAMLVKPGDTVTGEVVDGVFRIVSPAVALQRVHSFAQKFKAENPGVSVVDELIADRREEARKELEAANEWRKARGLPAFE